MFKITFKGFEISIHKNTYGFYNFSAIIYKNKGFREEEYFSTYYNSLNNNKVDATNNFKGHLLKVIKAGFDFKSNGLEKAYYLPSIKVTKWTINRVCK